MPEHARPQDLQPLRPTLRDRVPVLPPGAPYLLRALHEDLPFNEIARAIERVPSVAGRLLALANSAWSSPISPVTSLEAACSRLGLRVVRTASIALAVAQPFNPARCPAFDAAAFWISALLNAEAANALAQRIQRDEVSTARTAALLSNLGLLWLAEALPRETGAALEATHDGPPGSLDRHLEALCGLGYIEASAQLAEAWNLPEVLQEAIASQQRADAQASVLAQLVSAATSMRATLQRDSGWTEDLRLLRLGLDPAAQQAAFAQLKFAQVRTVELAETLFAGH